MTAPQSSALTIDSVTIQRAGRTIVHDLSLTVAAGEIFALLGGNGAGKSTTLAAIMGFLPPASGIITITGTNPATEPEQARQKIAYLPENVALYDHLTAIENIGYFMALAGSEPSAEAIAAALVEAGLARDAHHRRIGAFSKGMRQKVAIALALLRETPLLLLDEPTSGLDPRATADFTALLQAMRAKGRAILMVTHDLLGAADCADRIGFLDAGRLVDVVNVADGVDVMALHRRYGESAVA
ncbi:MAG: ABC transporter ATP-binding protein [Sphingopyxis sp.]|jgi:ABC-2 type transport system ATP-binding protein|nr:ABC transporter ATP-binding protein [Sphingopyxis sp.]